MDKRGPKDSKTKRHRSERTHESTSTGRHRRSREKDQSSEKRNTTTETLPTTSTTAQPSEYASGPSLATYDSGTAYGSHNSIAADYRQSAGYDNADTLVEQFERTQISQQPPYANPYGVGNVDSAAARAPEASHSSHSSDPIYNTVQKPSRFFKVGRVFKTTWAEVAGDVSDDEEFIVTSSNGGKIYTKARRFVVVREKTGCSICLPLNTYNRRGITKGTRDYAAVCAAGRERSLTSDQKSMAKKPISIIVEAENEKIDAKAYINFGRPSTVPHTIKVMKLGRVHPDHLDRFGDYFEDSMRKPKPSSGSANQTSRQTPSTTTNSTTPNAQYSAMSNQGSSGVSTYMPNNSGTAGTPQGHANTMDTFSQQSAYLPGAGGAYLSSGSNTNPGYQVQYSQQISPSGYSGYNESNSNNTYYPAASSAQNTVRSIYTVGYPHTSTSAFYRSGGSTGGGSYQTSTVPSAPQHYSYPITNAGSSYQEPNTSVDDDNNPPFSGVVTPP